MVIVSIHQHLKETYLQKGFVLTLTGYVLKWILNVPPYSITSFSHLINLFNNQFCCNRTFEKLTSDLYKVTQDNNESLRDYVSRFGKEALNIPYLDVVTVVQDFKMGLNKYSIFYEDLVIRFVRLKEDKKIQKRMNTSYDHPNRKNEFSSQKSYRAKSYSRPENHSITGLEDEDYPNISV